MFKVPWSIYYVWNKEEPEKCTCGRMDVLEEGMIRTTVNFTKVLRKQNWENTKIQILSQDMVRRLMNTKEELGATNRGAVVDMYAKKLLQSGYSRE